MILPDTPGAHARAAQLIAGGGVIGFRTDTFYGLGADPFNRAAVEAVNALKGRDGKPILVVVSDPRQAARFVSAEGDSLFAALAERHWPGALTIVAAAREELPEGLTAGTGTVGVRLPDDGRVRALVSACGGALTATSANPAGQPPARTAWEVEDYFGALLPLVVDGGATQAERPSTVVAVSGHGARLVREGAVGREEIARTLEAAGARLE
jgi:L-threonylcarbamoyladenylate synthase